MRDEARKVLFDATRLIAHGWTRRHGTGIDRVVHAYMRAFRGRALAVLQHRGIIRILPAARTEQLFDLVGGDRVRFRRRIVPFVSGELSGRAHRIDAAGMAYLNVGHTDFDLASHIRWTKAEQVRPFYFIHDLIPLTHPEFSRRRAVRRHSGRVREALRHAAGIITPSHAVARELADHAARNRLPLPPVCAAHLAGRALDTPSAVPRFADPYFLCIATIEPRKNHRMLFKVWERLVERLGTQAPRLVLVGQEGPLTGDILRPLIPLRRAGARIELLTDCDDAALAGLVVHARALLMPTLAEGFGLPFVEALGAGRPVIASDLPVFREIGQDQARLLDPRNPIAWEDAILAHLTAPHAPAVRKAFDPPTWDSHFDAVERFIADTAADSALSARSPIEGLAA